MKTVEEILKHKIDNWHFSNGQTLLSLDIVSDLMKEYAFEVAKNALDMAAKKYDNVHMKDSWGCTCDVPNAIRSTPIELR